MSKLFWPFAMGEDAPAPNTGQAPSPHRLDETLSREPEGVTRILIVDDDHQLLDEIAEALENPLFDVRTAKAADAFYAAFDAARPDIVITDLAMPSHDGTDILRGLQTRGYGGNVILMSGAAGHVLETTRRMATTYGLHISDALRKPFTPEQLVKSIRSSTGSATGKPGTAAALADRRIRPYFQPKIDLKTGQMVGAEALSRWLHPEKGLLMPQGYLGAARAAGAHCLHDLTILERALEFCAKLNDEGHSINIAVNFAADVILSDHFLDVVADARKRYGIEAEQLTIELTESEIVQNYDALIEKLLKLRLSGAHLSIDDFGTGYSSLSRIQQLPASEIKIDRSFIHGLTEYSGNLAIVRSVIELAHTLHCTVVAEGVETLETRDVLADLGCDLAQGYLFSPAVNEPTFLALVRDGALANT